MLNIVLFGPPGAGKGTQSEKLIAEYQLVHLSTGDILRAEVAAGTELGREAKKLMDEGILVPDEIVIEMISNKLDQNKHVKGFIFDGFPRTANQARALDKLLAEKKTAITKMISLKVNDEELMNRLLKRGRESGRPDDQDQDIILNRIQEYNLKTAPLEDYYADQGKFEAIDGIGEISEIFYAISSVIKEAELKEAFANPSDDFEDDEEEEELVESEKEESFISKATHVAKVVKEVVTSKVHDMLHPGEKKEEKKAPAKKAPAKAKADKPAKKAAVKKSAPKKKTAKKASSAKASAAKSAKKAAPKKAGKKAAKKVVKKVAKKVTKKVAKKAAKKSAPKKATKKKVVKKTAKKVTKKVAKKAAKKSAPKKSAKKAAKKASPKKAAKKGKKASPAKASAAKSAPKKSAKKAKKGKRK